MKQARSDRACDPGSGNAFVEFALVFLLLMILIVGMFEFSWMLFVRATLHHAVREGVRHAITGNSLASIQSPQGLDASIKEVIKRSSFGLLDDAALAAHLSIEFFDPTCAGQICAAGGAASPAVAPAESGSIVRVSIQCYDITPITSLIRDPDQVSGQPLPFTLSITASDKMEPFPGGAPDRGSQLASPTACGPTT